MYETPALNECIYAHNLRIKSVGDLTPYLNVSCLYLERNRIPNLDGLKQLRNLKYLNINFNMIENIDLCEGFDFLEELHVVGNSVSSVEFPSTKKLSVRVMKLSRNRLTELYDFSSLSNLECLDLSHNFIQIPEKPEIDFFLQWSSQRLPKSLKQLYLTPNEFVRTIPRFRQTIIVNCRHLVYLDNAPVTSEEVEIAEAELIHGSDAGLAVRRNQIERAEKERIDQMNRFRLFQQSHTEIDVLRSELLTFIQSTDS